MCVCGVYEKINLQNNINMSMISRRDEKILRGNDRRRLNERRIMDVRQSICFAQKM